MDYMLCVWSLALSEEDEEVSLDEGNDLRGILIVVLLWVKCSDGRLARE